MSLGCLVKKVKGSLEWFNRNRNSNNKLGHFCHNRKE
jgi:hypothetical protein